MKTIQEQRKESIETFQKTLNEIYEIMEKHDDFEELFEELEGWDYELYNDEGRFDFQYKNITGTINQNRDEDIYNGSKIELSCEYDYYLHSDYDYYIYGTKEEIIYKLKRFDFEKLNLMETEQFNTDKVIVEFTDNVTENRKESLFYQGQVAIVEHDDYPEYSISIEARGEVRISDDEEFLRARDLPFDDDDPNKRLMTDQDLERNIKELNDTYNEKYEGNYSMGNNNWYEYFVVGPGDYFESAGDVSYLIDNAIKNAVDNFEEIIEDHLFKEERINVRADYISIYDGKGEITRWTRDEWLEDPDILVPIVNAAMIVADKEDKRSVREILNK
jgi:hypothetical protein